MSLCPLTQSHSPLCFYQCSLYYLPVVKEPSWMTFKVTLLFWVFSSSFLWAERNRVQQPKNVIDSLMKIPKHTTTTNGSWYVADGRDISCPFIPTPCVLFFDSFLREQRSLVLPKNSLKYFLTPNSRFQTMSDLSLYCTV